MMSAVGRGVGSQVRDDVAELLDRARNRTLALLERVPAAELERQHSPLQSPLIWDFAHIGYFEELWLLRELGVDDAMDPRFDDLYDAFQHERSERGELPILTSEEARAFVADVRQRALDALEGVDFDDARLTRDGFVYGLVAQHELQHQETMLQTLDLAGIDLGVPERDVDGAAPVVDEIVIPAGTFVLGTDSEPWAYDNERPAHGIELPTFAIDRLPVTNARWLEFVEDGGYRRREHWTEHGWEWVRAEEVAAPLNWELEGAIWQRRRFGQVEEIPPAEPVQHISWWEADAFARWAGKRLPSEAEWERAAAGAVGGNVGVDAFGPLPVGERGIAASGCACMLGDVWEWTSSYFLPYPGFEPFPYREYSEVFFGDEYRVLRGGSWATDPVVARVTFRNWDYPQRRQIFSGVRLARDV